MLPSGSWHATDMPKHVVVDSKRPRLYYEALATCQAIFNLFPQNEDVLPVIHHGMPSAYYKALTNATNTTCIEKLMAIMDSAADVAKITNKAFAEIVDIRGGAMLYCANCAVLVAAPCYAMLPC